MVVFMCSKMCDFNGYLFDIYNKLWVILDVPVTKLDRLVAE
jgi:hypothetical protein